MNQKLNCSGVLQRDTMIYYVGSVFFAAGIGLLAIGAAIVMMWRINYRSEPEEILISAIFMGAGAILILIGINMIMKQTQYGYHIVTASAFISFLALFMFKSSYPHEWHYPLVSYVVALYVGGFLVLLGNAFANVVLWMIHDKPESGTWEKDEMKLYTDEEIERDIEEATRKSIELAASELKFNAGNEEGNIKVGKAFHKSRGNTTRVKDEINEAKNLLKTISPKEKVKSGSAEVDAISMQLSEAMKNQPDNKGRFGLLKEDIEYKFERLVGLVK
jgi:hypothetical protein